MNNKLLTSVMLSTFVFMMQTGLAEDKGVLFYRKGKPIFKSEISPAYSQKIFEAERQYYLSTSQIYQEIFLEMHLQDEAKNKNSTPEAIRREFFKSSLVGEKKAKEWFEENKAKLGGRSFESIKGEIIGFLTRIEEEKAANIFFDKMRKNGDYKDNLKAPMPISIDIKVSEFPKRGAINSKIKVIEFADYRCPHCIKTFSTMEKIVEKYKNKVEFTYIDFPLSDLSSKISAGGVCSNQQNKFWDYYTLAFKANGNFDDKSPETFAKDLKLDLNQFNSCYSHSATKEKVKLGQNEARRIGVTGTPAIYINGIFQHSTDEEDLSKTIESLF